MKYMEKEVCRLIRAALYDLPYEKNEGMGLDEILDELQSQSVALVPSEKLKGILPEGKKRKSYIFFAAQQIAFWNRIMFCQQEITRALWKEGVRVVILKGAAAAMYYPVPEYRSMGDIDLIVRPEDFDRAFEIMEKLEDMYTPEHKDPSRRHEIFEKNGIHIELHRYFFVRKDGETGSYLDERICEGILHASWHRTAKYMFPVLPALENGLVLLQHISQHLETGLGLRQILDWMLYVEKELTDAVWKNSFAQEAEKIGLKKLALVATRMSQIYLGLAERITWCAGTDEALCARLMEYVIDHGNFGRKDIMSSRTVPILYTFKNPASLLKQAQRSGCLNWEILERLPVLKPFAWLYQLCRWAGKGVQRDGVIKGLTDDIKKAASQDKFLDELGVWRRKNER